MSGKKREFEKGYYPCPICGRMTLHDWVSPMDVQEYEIWDYKNPIPDDIFVCLKCQKVDIDDEA